MIINTQTAAYQPLSPAPARTGKSVSGTHAASTTDTAQLTSSTDQLAVSENNFTAAIQDMDGAKSSVEFARKSILAQPNMAMMTQANSIAQDALRLLQE
jgi:flagellin-like hook-associated protein FlgL